MIYIILGTKGQFTKMFPLMRVFDENGIEYKFIHTGQHYGIVESNIKRFKVRKPDVYLTIKKEDLKNIWEMMLWIPKVLWNARNLHIKRKDFVIIHGDAESTLLGFLIGKFFDAKVVHIEAGYRSGSIFEPFPEEIIRRVVDRFSDVAFTPYKEFVPNMRRNRNTIVTNGNTVFDSVKFALKEVISKKAHKLMSKTYVIFLIHRKENVFVKSRLKAILRFLEVILKKDFRVIWVVHANTKFELEKQDVWKKILKLQSRYDLVLNYFFDYVDFMHLVKNSEFIASDGGGLQKETYFLNKPMLILRKRTENEPGVGENSYLSELKMKNIIYFVNNYKKFRRKKSFIGSPTKTILDYFRNVKQ